MLEGISDIFRSMRVWLLHEHAFRLTPAQRKRFSIQAQYDANETFINLLHWSGTTLQARCRKTSDLQI